MSGTGWDDERGVSEVLGAMLLFGIVIVALGGYQAFIVPQQNAEIELKHDAQVNDEFGEIQLSISNAAATGTSRTTSITMGTRYPTRVAGLNPPTVSGQLATRSSGTISASGFDDTDLETICGLSPESRAITYDADYHELNDPGTFVYENGVTYRDVGDRILVRNDQELVDGSTIRLFPLTGEGFSTGSSSSKQMRFVPGETGTQTVDTDGDNLTLTFPSRAGDTTWNDEILDGSTDVKVSKSGEKITLTFDPGTYKIQCTPVGIGSEPDQGFVPSEDADPEEEANEINPDSAGKVVLIETSTIHGNGDKNVTLTFKNRTNAASELSIVGARLNYYFTGGPAHSAGPKPETVEIGSTVLDVGGEFKTLNEPVSLKQDETEVELDFDEDIQADHLYVLTLEISHGDVSTYFVSHSQN